MGTIKTTNIETITGSGTLTLGQSGETISIPSGATLDLSNATQTGVGGTNTPAFEAYRSGDVAMSANTNTLIAYNVEVFDTDNCYDNTTNYRFTPNVAGKYFFFASAQTGDLTDAEDYQISIRKNGTTVSRARTKHHYGDNINTEVIVDMNGTTDYIDVFTQWQVSWTLNGSDLAATRFGGYKIIE